MKVSMLTTIDNPFDPFEKFEDWQKFDEDNGYFSLSFLARLALTSDILSQEENETAIEQAIDEIVRENVLGLYRKVTRET